MAELEIADPASPLPLGSRWSEQMAQELQVAVDAAFADGQACGLGDAKLSLTIADPMLEDCPLVCCSAGFRDLVGYDMDFILGRNCRFLLDPVSPTLINHNMRRHVKEFCQAVAQGKPYSIPMEEREPWTPDDRNTDELFAFQVNAKKDGTLFNNMFYLKVLYMGTKVGEEKPFIVGLQTKLTKGKEDMEALVKNLEQLDKNMDEVEAALTKMFFLQTGLRRQCHEWDPDEDDRADDEDEA